MKTIFITVDKIDETKGKISLKHFQPSELQEEEKAKGYIVDYEEPIEIEGKVVNEYYVYATGKIEFEYIDMPKTEEQITKERIAQLETENASINYALMMGGLI